MPILRAQFDLDEAGSPKYVESGGHQHYKIKLSVKEVPENTYAVTYILHESYYEPVREVRNSEDGYAENTTSYGDYTIKVKVRTSEDVQTLQDDLSEALRKEYQGASTPQIYEAIERIKKY